MVLQANANPSVFGTATPGEKITVRFAGHVFSTNAGSHGQWNVQLGHLKPGEGGDLSVEGKNKIVCKNVIAGEVWFCSGQSNMAYPVSKCTDAQRLLSEKQNDNVRFFFVPPDMSNAELKDVKSRWHLCDKTMLPAKSAVAYIFATNLQKTLNSPVGIIQSAFGGSSIKTWISKDVLQADKDIAEKLSVKPNTPAAFMQFAIAKNQRERQSIASAGAPIAQNMGQPLVPCSLFNAMVAPFTKFQIRGVAWYQGEADAEEATLYEKLFPAMIADWRKRWNQANLTFLFVQLPNFENDSFCKPSKDAWAKFRDVQARCRSVHDTAMVVAIDQGEAHNLHPPAKTVVAKRLSAAALKIVYKKKGYEAAGPSLLSLQRSGSKLICKFRDADGLHTKSGQPEGFELSGSDGKFLPATAVIVGQTLVLSNPTISLPKAARYAWANNPRGNIYNHCELPAVPFNAAPGAI